MIKFITAIHFTQNGQKKVVFYSNYGTTCLEASELSKVAAESFTVKNAKDIRYHTYELGAVNHQIEAD